MSGLDNIDVKNMQIWCDAMCKGFTQLIYLTALNGFLLALILLAVMLG